MITTDVYKIQVLICSNLLISLFRKVIPNGVRMPAYIVIVASLVTVVQFLMPVSYTHLDVYKRQDKKVNEISKEERNRLLMLFKKLPVTLNGPRGYNLSLIHI